MISMNGVALFFDKIINKWISLLFFIILAFVFLIMPNNVSAKYAKNVCRYERLNENGAVAANVKLELFAYLTDSDNHDYGYTRITLLTFPGASSGDDSNATGDINAENWHLDQNVGLTGHVSAYTTDPNSYDYSKCPHYLVVVQGANAAASVANNLSDAQWHWGYVTDSYDEALNLETKGLEPFDKTNSIAMTLVENAAENAQNNAANAEDMFNQKIGCEALFDTSTEGSVGWILARILTYIRIFGPIAVVLLTAFDFIKAILSSNEEEMKKSQSRFIIRLLAAIALFLIPTIIELVFNIILGVNNPTCQLM